MKFELRALPSLEKTARAGPSPRALPSIEAIYFEFSSQKISLDVIELNNSVF